MDPRPAKKGFLFGWRLIDEPLLAQFVTAGAIVFVSFSASLFLLLAQVRRQADASRVLNSSNAAVSRLTILARDFYRQQSAVFDFAQTGSPQYLPFVEEGRKVWSDGFTQVQSQQLGPQFQETIRKLGEQYQAWNRLMQPLLDRPGVPSLTTAGEEAKISKEIFQLIDRAVAELNGQIAGLNEHEKDAVQRTFAAVVILNFLLLVVFGYVLTRLYLSIARPIAALSEGMDRYQNGDFTARIPVPSRSQIGRLTANFNEMAEKIETMVADLRRLDEMKSDFISTVSHELRTPLTSISGYTQLLRQGDAGTINELQKEFLEIVDTNVRRLGDLINDVLDVEKMESGKLQLHRERMDLGTVLRECRDTFSVVASNKGLQLKLKMPDRELPVLGDRSRLVQLFMNLVSNAVKYTKTGYVEIEAELQGYAVIVRVRDTGVGIPEDEQERLFQRFYRVRQRESSEPGTGLGLVIARGLAEAHGGRISLSSQVGEGTVFTVALPAAAAVTATVHETAHADESRLIWIVDPHAEDADAMEKAIVEDSELSSFKDHLRRFRSIAEIPAFEGRESNVALVVIDPRSSVTLAPNDVKNAVSAVRQILKRPVPILIAAEAADPAAAFAEGAAAVISKPVTHDQFAENFAAAVKDLAHARRGKILLADQNMDLRLLIRRSLEQKGFAVDDVDRGNLVLRRLGQESYDLILLDLNFSDVSGLELLKSIRKDPKFRHLPVFVMLDEDKNPPSPEQLLSAGADQFVGKYAGIGGIADAVALQLEHAHE